MSKNATSAGNQQGSPLILDHDPSETTRRIPRVNRDMAYLLGLLYTDGCVSPKGVNSWRIYFSARSEELVLLFKKSMLSCFNLQEKRVRLGRTQDNLHVAIVDSKEIGSYLTKRFGTFRTLQFNDGEYTDARLPVDELIDSGYVAEFLQVAFSCDGCVTMYPAHRVGKHGRTTWLIRTIFVACKPPKIRLDYLDLLSSLGIQARNVSGDRKIKIEDEKNIRLFHSKIGFLPGVKVTGNGKYWQGSTKEEILEELILSYDNPSSVYTHSRFTT